MGSVFRKVTTRPVPAGATITERAGKLTARWKSRAGKWRTSPVVTTEEGRRLIRQESTTYFAKYRDHDGTVHVVATGCGDVGNARQKLAQLEKQVGRVHANVITSEEKTIAEKMTDPIQRHIDDYVLTLKGSKEHRGHTKRYLRRLATELEWQSLADLRRDHLELWLAAETAKGRSARSLNGYHIAATSFANWCVKVKRLMATPFVKIPMADVDEDRRRIRRSLSADEVERLAQAAERAPERPPLKQGERNGSKAARPAQRLTGRDRAFLWRFLAGTGLRLNEARGLRVGNLILDGERPGIDLPAKITKAKKQQYVPLLPHLAEHLREQVAGRKPTEPVFTIPADILRRFKADCKRAGIPFQDDRGYVVDIHALRTSFIDGLAMAGVPPHIVQALARHADMETTMSHYTDVRIHDLHAAVAFVAPSVAPTVGISGATESSPGNASSSENSPQVVISQRKRRFL